MDRHALKVQIIQDITEQKSSTVPQGLSAVVDKCMAMVEALSMFAPVSRRGPCHINPSTNQVCLGATDIISESLRQFLEASTESVLMAATLGPRVERHLSILQMTDMAQAYVFDVVCLHHLEMALDLWETQLRQAVQKEGFWLSPRFSPGYGDVPLSVQGAILKHLDASKRLGITLTQSHLMVPQKSVTAILGISQTPYTKQYRRCDACLKRAQCHKKEGDTCAYV